MGSSFRSRPAPGLPRRRSGITSPSPRPAGRRPTQISTIKSLVAQHAAAIAFDTDEPAAVKQVLPALAQARAAGIPTLSYELPLSRQRLGQPVQPGAIRAGARRCAGLTDATRRGQFVIVSCRPAELDRRHRAEVDQGLHPAALPADASGRSRLRRPRERRRGHAPVQPPDAGTPAAARPDLPLPRRGLQPAAAAGPGRTRSARSSPPATAATAHRSTTPTSPPFGLEQRRSSAPATRPSSAI